MKRCHCGEYELPDLPPWVTLPAIAHTEARCGMFVAISASALNWHGTVALDVTWEES